MKGSRFKLCQGMTDHYLCCRLHILDQAENCPYNCSYCFLQSYLGDVPITIATDHDALLEEIRRGVEGEPERLFRVCTGELSDSLALEGSREFARKAVPFFAKLPNTLLELKTKSAQVETLLDLKHGGRTVVSWSVNPRGIIDREELGTASLAERLEAARRVVEAGYLTGFHFDPLIHHEGFEKNYTEVVDRIFEAVPAEKIAWISLGTLRFPPDMKRTVLDRHPGSRIMLEEFVRGFDGKMRYFKPIRRRLYAAALNALKQKGADVLIYFCMENAETWERFMGWAPESSAHLDFHFADRLHRKFPGLLSHPPRRESYS